MSLQFTPLSGEYLSLFLVLSIFTTVSHAKNLSSFKFKKHILHLDLKVDQFINFICIGIRKRERLRVLITCIIY